MQRRTRVRYWGQVVALTFIIVAANACGGGAVATVAPTPTAPPPTATIAATSTTISATATNLPPTATAAPPTKTPLPPTATPVPVVVETRKVVTTKNSSGQPLIIGEIVNVGPGDVGDLKVILAVIDGAGKTASVPTAVIALEALAPGEKTVWQATVTEKIETIKEVQAQAQAARLSTSLRDRLYKDIKVEGLSFSSRTGQQPTVWANGQIANTGSANATVGVWMAVYGADGQLTHVGFDSAARLYQIQAGKQQPFLIELSGISEIPLKYELWIRSSKREAAFSSTVIDLEAQKVSIIKNPGAAPSVLGELLNPSKVDVASFNLVIAFLDDTGKIVGVGGGSIAANLLIPGERTVWRSSFFSGMTDKTAFKEVRVQAQSLVASEATKRMSARDLRVVGETIAPSGAAGSYLRVNAQLTNTGTQPTVSAVVYVAIYSAEGTLLFVEAGFPQPSQIAAGGSAPFTINLITLKELPAKYEFFIAAAKSGQ